MTNNECQNCGSTHDVGWYIFGENIETYEKLNLRYLCEDCWVIVHDYGKIE